MPSLIQRLCILSLAVVAAATLPPGLSSAPASPSLVVDLPAQVQVGQPIQMRLTVRDVADIGGYELSLRYDTSIVEFNSLHQRANDLPTVGRAVGPLGPVERADGATFGLYSCPYADCVRPAADSPRQTRGASGTVRLADLSLIANQPGLLEIALADARFVAADGTVIDITLPPTLTVQVGAASGPRHAAPPRVTRPTPQPPTSAPGPFDLTGDGRVDHADSMLVAIPWATTRYSGNGCGISLATLDVNHDGCLDIVDLQLVAHHYTDIAPSMAPLPPRPKNWRIIPTVQPRYPN